MHSFTIKSNNNLHPLYKLILLILFFVPIHLCPQKKIMSPVIVGQQPSVLSKVFKKYHLFNINTSKFFNYTKASGKAPVNIVLDLSGENTLSLSPTERNILSNSCQIRVASANGKKISSRTAIRTYGGKMVDDEDGIVLLTVSVNIYLNYA